MKKQPHSDTAASQIALRVSPDMEQRVDALLPKLAKDATLSAVGRVTRSTVLKLALSRGLEVLEREYK